MKYQIEFKPQFLDLQQWLEDAEDLLDLRDAQKAEANAPTISLAEVEKESGIR